MQIKGVCPEHATYLHTQLINNTNMTVEKNKIIISNIPKNELNKFNEEFSQKLHVNLFIEKYPAFKANLQSFTNLAFFNRIIIILNDSNATSEIFQYLLQDIKTDGVKITISQDLLKRPQLTVDSNLARNENDKNKTELHYFIDDSPTLLKFAEKTKCHYYSEPLPTKKTELKINTNVHRNGSDERILFSDQENLSPNIVLNGFTF